MTLVKTDADARFSITKALGPVSIATNTNTLSAAIDLSAFPGWKVLVIAATGTRTDGTYTPSLHQADTSGGSYAAIPAVASGDVAAVSAADTVRKATYIPTKPFVKVNILSASVTTGALLTAFVVLTPPTS